MPHMCDNSVPVWCTVHTNNIQGVLWRQPLPIMAEGPAAKRVRVSGLGPNTPSTGGRGGAIVASSLLFPPPADQLVAIHFSAPLFPRTFCFIAGFYFVGHA